MSLKQVFRGFSILLSVSLILSGCASPVQSREPELFPTPTSGARFSGEEDQEIIDTGIRLEGTHIVPTVANLFQDNSRSQNPIVTVEPQQPSRPFNTPHPPVYRIIPIYTEALHPDWEPRRNNDVDVDLISSQAAYTGTVSLAVTPKEGDSLLLFSVKKDVQDPYLRDEILGLSFWLNSGEQSIEPDDMSVTVLGSNAYPYWVSEDTSVKNVVEPVFSETRLYYLGINRAIPPNTWVKIDFWLDERIYDPDYVFVTGFYIRTTDAITNTFFIDNIEFISIDSDLYESAGATAEPPSQAEINEDLSEEQLRKVIAVQVDVKQDVHPISPLIYGVSTAGKEYLESLQPTVTSWGGNPSTRFNWKIGHAWNAGRDYFYKNGNYGVTSGSASDMFVEESLLSGAEVRLAVPTLGWVAKNDNLNTCSFPLPNGECTDWPQISCENPSVIADPTLANVKSDVDSIQEWIRHLFEKKGFDIRFIAMDNEPELWGYTHYDVHPTCTTYQEILDTYIAYSSAIREVAPQAELMGPVTSGWWFYWNSAAGVTDKLSHGNQNFLPWFLESVRQHEEKNDVKLLDVLDIHYYPQDVYNYEDDEETAALRLRSTRSLWDPNYVDESWINEPIYLIPRMKALIDEYAPGIQLGISEWNWGGEISMNGALAIADVLGIFGREELYFATYYGYPPEETPGFYAFKMYTNFDGNGSRFGDISVSSTTTNYDRVSSFAALDSKTGNLHLMLINKEPEAANPLQVDLNGFIPTGSADLFRYSGDHLSGIMESDMKISGDGFDIILPPYSITLIVLKQE